MDLIKYRRAALKDIRYIAHDAHFISWVSGLPKEVLILIIQQLVQQYKKEMWMYFELDNIGGAVIKWKNGKNYVVCGDEFMEFNYERVSRKCTNKYVYGEYDLVRLFREKKYITGVCIDYKHSGFNDILIDEEAEIIMAFNKPFFGIN